MKIEITSLTNDSLPPLIDPQINTPARTQMIHLNCVLGSDCSAHLSGASIKPKLSTLYIEEQDSQSRIVNNCCSIDGPGNYRVFIKYCVFP